MVFPENGYKGKNKALDYLWNKIDEYDTDEEKTKTLSVKGLSGIGQDLFKGGTLDLSAGLATVTLPPRESRFYLFDK